MEKEFHKKEAAAFTGVKDAYIHTEVKNGNAYTIIGGSGPALLYGVMAEIDRLGERFNMGFMDAWIGVRGMRVPGALDALTEGMDKKYIKQIQGEDMEEQIREDERKKQAEWAVSEIAKLKTDFDQTKRERDSAVSALEYAKSEFDRRIKEKDRRIMEQTKEINALNADIRRMEKRLDDESGRGAEKRLQKHIRL